MRKQLSLLPEPEPEIVGPATGGSITINSTAISFKQGDYWFDTSKRFTAGSGDTISFSPGAITITLT